MPDQEGNIYRVTELVGTSRNGFDDLLPGRTVHKEKPKAVDREPKSEGRVAPG